MNNTFGAFVRLVADPEKKEIKSDVSVVEFRVANNIRTGKGEVVLWIRCSVWNKQLQDVVLNYTKKGSFIFVSGELSQQEWEKDGVKNQSLQLTVDKVRLLDKKDDAAGENTSAEPTPKTANKTTKTTKTVANKPTTGNDDIPF